jgi:transposase
MSQPHLPMELPEPQEVKPEAPTVVGAARVLRAQRHQMEMVERTLDSTLPDDHPARAIWAFLERLDLAAFYARIKAVVDHPGHPATDPQVLLGLWIYATTEGVGWGARELARLCEAHDAYRWLRGGTPVNYHQLAEFRVRHQAAMDQLLTDLVAVLLAEQLVTLTQVSQDGVRVRASAGSSSFRREATLAECQQAAAEQVQRLAAQREHPDPKRNQRQQAAQERAARERAARVEQALAHLPALQAAKEKQRRKLTKKRQEKVSEARVSTTDPEARVMKMADGGFRPAYNAQFATDGQARIIVGVAVTNSGNDTGQGAPMIAQIQERTGRKPDAWLADGGYAAAADVVAVSEQAVEVYVPVRPPRTETSGRDSATPRASLWTPSYRGDPPAFADLRVRMGTEEAKLLYRQRGATAEWANAQARRFGLSQLPVRGLEKVRSVLLLIAISHNLLRWHALAPAV